jgi:hypothetical protein
MREEEEKVMARQSVEAYRNDLNYLSQHKAMAR